MLFFSNTEERILNTLADTSHEKGTRKLCIHTQPSDIKSKPREMTLLDSSPSLLHVTAYPGKEGDK